MDTDKLKMELMADEGVVLHAYKDSVGVETIGIGRNIDPVHGGGISTVEAMYLLDNDIRRTWMSLRAALPWIDALSDGRQRALVNMAFNLGVNGLLDFHNMLEAMRNEDWVGAVKELFNSKWAYQVDDGPGKHPGRADRLAALIQNG
jgi:lysozyme